MDGEPADGADPVAYQPILTPSPPAATPYTVHFLESGEYTVAATCQFDVDQDPSRSEFDPAAVVPPGSVPAMQFVRKNILITTGATARADFP
jgi:hypothetical protein